MMSRRGTQFPRTSQCDECDFYPLRMLNDRKTEMYVKFAKVMLIFQGPVTKKRHLAVSELATKFRYAGRIISDETFKTETLCRFSPENTVNFYNYFRARVKKSCEEGYNLIIIDQSMCNSSQMKYYFYLAQKMQYIILPYPPLFNADEETFNQSNQASSFPRIDHPNFFKHLFCGWFLHDVDSAELRDEASLYVKDCFENISEFSDMLSKKCSSDNFNSVFNLIEKRQDLACCIVKILRNPVDIKNYMSSNIFKKYYGSMSKLYIVGFVISPDIIAARVKLTHDQKQLWEMDDDLDEKQSINMFPSELLKSTKVDIPNEDITLVASKSNRTIITGDPIYEPTEVIHNKAKGRSCHILLGKTKDANVKNVDYDVSFALHREKMVQEFSDNVKPYDLHRCVVRRIGKYWLIYLKETLVVNGFFSTCCSLHTGM